MTYSPQSIGKIHSNRVHVGSLPPDVDKAELGQVFSRFNFTIRNVRIVETHGATNYGFVTFNSKEEADEVLKEAKAGNLTLRGQKLDVGPAYNKHPGPAGQHDNSQFAQAMRGMCQSWQDDVAANLSTPCRASSGTDNQYERNGSYWDHQRYASSSTPLHYQAQPATQLGYQFTQQATATGAHSNSMSYSTPQNYDANYYARWLSDNAQGYQLTSPQAPQQAYVYQAYAGEQQQDDRYRQMHVNVSPTGAAEVPSQWPLNLEPTAHQQSAYASTTAYQANAYGATPQEAQQQTYYVVNPQWIHSQDAQYSPSGDSSHSFQ